MVDSLSKPFDSRYRAEQNKTLSLGFLEGDK